MKFIKLKEFLKNHKLIIKTSLSDDVELNSINSLLNAQSKDLTFFNDKRLIHNLKTTKAKACFVSVNFVHLLPKSCYAIVVGDPYEAFAYSTNFFYPKRVSENKISQFSFISKDAILEKNIDIGNFVNINKNSEIGQNVIIDDNVIIKNDCKIGDNTIIQSGCIISNAIIGSNCHIQSGTVIGDTGFGFELLNKVTITHIGNVIIGKNVHIGSNVTIDRATLDSTIIGDNVRIDNLVHIAHNVQIGKNTVIAAQSGIAGSAILGNNCILGGQVGISGHIKIGNNVTIAAKSGVTKNIDDNSIIGGYPAIDLKKWKKSIINQYKNSA
jgi:UDP-3-O-[3-hydroxymyristoyl] glucosamine N-acyltransferase